MATNPHEAVARCTEARVVPCGSVGLWGTIEFSSSITSGVSVYKDLLGCIRKFINLYTVNVFQRNIYEATQNNTVSRKQPSGRHRNLVAGPMLMILRKLCSPSRPPPRCKEATIYLQVFVLYVKLFNFHLLARFFLQQEKIEAHT